MFGQSLLSAFGSAACTTDTDQLFGTNQSVTSTATYQLNSGGTSIPSNTYPLTTSNVTYTAGKFGNAATFTGSNAGSGTQLSVSNSIYQGNTSIFSVSLWVKCTNTVGEIPLSGNGGTIGGTQGYALYLNNGSLALTFRSSNGSQDFYYGSSINDNAWHNVVLTFNNGPYAVYLDGTLDFSGTTGNFLNNTTPSFNTFFGNRWGRAGDNNAVIAGQMDQIRVFGSTVLPQAAITALYNETTTTAQSASVSYQLANPNSIAYYKMSDATDQLGNYNGTATNVNFNTEGKFGFAGAFNGSSSLIQTGYTVPAISAYSLSLWFKSTSTSRQFLFSDYNSGGSDATTRLTLSINSGNFSFVLGNGSSSWSDGSVSASSYLDGNWHNLVLVINGTSVKLYADGNTTPIADLTSTVSAGTAGTEPIEIGTSGFGSYFFNGSIDQIRIYDATISAANVTTLYNEIECPAVAVTNAFNTVLWTGDGASSKSITSLGFKPDMIWIKARSSAYSHNLQDSVRGGGASTALTPNVNVAEGTYGIYGFVNTFDSNGFTVGTGSSNNIHVNNNNTTYVSWNWKAGGTAVSNTDGTITSQVSANVDAGFSIVSYTGNLQAGASIGHSLGVKPDLIITKSTSNAESWEVWSSALNNGGVGQQLRLNSSNAAFSATDYYSTPDTSKFYVGGFTGTNGNGYTYVSYCFHSVAGYSKVGSYVGTGAAGNSIFTGFEPAFVMFKNTNAGNVWTIFDNKRNPTNPVDLALFPNLDNAEYDYPTNGISFNTNGFTLNSAGAEYNENTYSYIFLAIA